MTAPFAKGRSPGRPTQLTEPCVNSAASRRATGGHRGPIVRVSRHSRFIVAAPSGFYSDSKKSCNVLNWIAGSRREAPDGTDHHEV